MIWHYITQKFQDNIFMKPLLEYALFFSIIMFAAIIYFKIAAYYNIVDKPMKEVHIKYLPSGEGELYSCYRLFYFIS